jgi:hypothetical protein
MYTLYTFKRTLVSLAFLLLVVPGSGIGKDAEGGYGVYGFGGESCGRFVEARRDRQDPNSWSWVIYMGWVTGYLSAVNGRMPDTLVSGHIF